jgi:serine/threonine-protein kinase
VTGHPDGSEVLAQLERVLRDETFARNQRLSAFLRYIVERSVDGRTDELKESVIAVAVFGRAPDYDPKRDSIVRTEAARLRSRLSAFYADAGSADAVVIDVPKGGYVAVFRLRTLEVLPVSRRSLAAPLLVLGAVIVIAVLGAAVAWRIRLPTSPIAVAVLPFDNVDRNAAEEYFADGLTDETIRQLSNIEGLAVRSRTSSFLFKGRPRNIQDIAQQLQVDYVIEGAVSRDASRVRINVQLIRARDDAPVWAGRYDRELQHVFAVEDEISIVIVNQLRLHIGGGRRRYETSMDAYDLYLRARALVAQGHVEGSIASIPIFQSVIQRDPDFAPAYAGLAIAYAIRSNQFPPRHPPEELNELHAAADRAIALDPLLAESHSARALSYARDGEWALSERSFRRAIELDPNRASTYVEYAMWMLYATGRVEDGIDQIRRAMTVDPLWPELYLDAAWLLMSAHRYAQAGRYCQQLPPDYPFRIQCLARWHLAEGRHEEAIALLSRDPSLSRNPQTRGLLGYAYAHAGRSREAEEMAAQSQFANERALIFAGIRDKPRTMTALQETAALGPQRLGRYIADPEFAFLQRDPQLAALLRRVGLPPR